MIFGEILDQTRQFDYHSIQIDEKIMLITSNMMKRNSKYGDKWLQITNTKEDQKIK